MCGRFALRRLPQQMLLDLRADDVPALEPRFNVAPTQDVAVVRTVHQRREVAMLHWGLIPAWADDPKIGARMINARCETVHCKPAFKRAFERRRCLVLADGYYEWERIGSRKQPYLITLEDERPFCMAGLWERWYGHGSAKLEMPLESCTIITTDANPQIASLHERMPVILDEPDWDCWLDPNVTGTNTLRPRLAPYAGDDMSMRKVSTYVNNAHHEGDACVQVQRELF